MPHENNEPASIPQAAEALTSEKHHALIDRPRFEIITSAWRAGQDARSAYDCGERERGPCSNPHDDWWLGTAWADGWHWRDSPLRARRWATS